MNYWQTRLATVLLVDVDTGCGDADWAAGGTAAVLPDQGFITLDIGRPAAAAPVTTLHLYWSTYYALLPFQTIRFKFSADASTNRKLLASA